MRLHVTINVPDTAEGIVTDAATLLAAAERGAAANEPPTDADREITDCLAARLDEFYIDDLCVVLAPANVTIRVER